MFSSAMLRELIHVCLWSVSGRKRPIAEARVSSVNAVHGARMSDMMWNSSPVHRYALPFVLSSPTPPSSRGCVQWNAVILLPYVVMPVCRCPKSMQDVVISTYRLSMLVTAVLRLWLSLVNRTACVAGITFCKSSMVRLSSDLLVIVSVVASLLLLHPAVS